MNKYIYLFIYLFIYLLIINKHSFFTFFTGQWPCTCSRTSAKEARFNSVPLHWTRSSNYFLQLRHSTPPVRTATRHGEETEQDSADGRKFVRPVLSVMSVALMHVQNLTNWQLTADPGPWRVFLFPAVCQFPHHRELHSTVPGPWAALTQAWCKIFIRLHVCKQLSAEETHLCQPDNCSGETPAAAGFKVVCV